MNCPRCKTPVGPLSNPDSIVTCPGCGSRLMTRSAALRSQGGPRPSAPPLPAPQPAPSLAEHPPSATLPPTPALVAGLTGLKTAPTAQAAPLDGASRPAGRNAAADGDGDAKEDDRPAFAALASILSEVQAVRATQQLVLEALEELRRAVALRPAGIPAPAGPADPDAAEAPAPTLSPIRARRRKTVVLVDDDPKTREAAVTELQHAEVPVRAFAEGNAALSAIAEEKPDVIVLELGTGGDMGGKDLVNFVKATMEWVDIPIILWTREPVTSQKEARQIHGADEVVPKSGGAAALVARVITVFRRG
jgi:CheY-like chemotaxis protein